MKRCSFRNMNVIGAICGSVLLLGSLGCGGSAEGVAPVSGRLTFNGEPLEGIEIEFTPLEEKVRPSIGVCDADGNYSLMFTRTEKGATIGRNRVSIVQPMDMNGVPDYSKIRVPPEFGEESELEYTVEGGGNSNVDFDLEVPEENIGQK